MTAILKEPAPELALPGADISSELEGIVGRCLEKNPAERFQSTSDLAFSLRETAKSSTQPFTAARAARRRRWIAGAVLAALLATAAALIVWRPWLATKKSVASGPAEGKRIAVIPFVNLGSEDDACFAAGVTDEITGRLASVRGLTVISRACAAQYAGSSKSAGEIGGELGVKYLLTGTVRWARSEQAADKVRITPELIRIADNTSLWSEIYEFTLDDIFGIQSQIARSVVVELGLKLLEYEPGSLEAKPTENIEAYQVFLRGRFLARQPHFTLTTWLSAIGNFERAVSLDPDFALAWAELARGHARLVYYRYDLSPERRLRARDALSRAQELAPSSPEVRLAAGYYHLWVERDTAVALDEFESASQGMPNSVEIQSARGELFRLHGEWARAIDAYRAATSLSPRDGSAMVDVAETLWWMRRYSEAVEAADRAIVLAPDQSWPYLAKAFAIWSWKGRDGAAECRAALEFIAENHEWHEWSWFWQEGIEGRYAEALERMEADPEGWIRIKIEAAPKVLFAAFLRASIGDKAAAKERFETALRMLEPQVRAAPEDGRYHSSLGIALAGLGRRAEAVREGRRGVELLPMSEDAVYGVSGVIALAQIYELLGDEEKAVEQLEHLLSRPGWISPATLRWDPRWMLLQGRPRFEALLARYETKRMGPRDAP